MDTTLRIDAFELLDLGVNPVGSFENWGVSFSPFSDAIVGHGTTAHEAKEDLLNRIALLGLDGGEVAESCKEIGFDSTDASLEIGELIEEGDPLEATENAYFVGLRFDDPREDSEGEPDEEQAQDE